MSFSFGRRFVGMFVAFAMLTAGMASAEYGPPGPRPGGYNPPGYNPPGYGPGNRPGYNPPGYNPGFAPRPVQPIAPGYPIAGNPPGYNPPGYGPGNPPGFNPPGVGVPGFGNPPGYNPPGVGPGNPPGFNPPGVGGPVVGIPAGVGPTFNMCSGRYEEAMGPVKQPNHSPMMKHWECLNELVGKYLIEVKGLTNLQVTDLQFNQAVAWGNPQILWSAEAVANRKMNIAKSWARGMELNADASWQFFKANKNICDVRCAQSFLNFIFTMNNTMFVSRDFDWYMRWQYDTSNWATGGGDVRNNTLPVAFGHLNAMQRYAYQIAHEMRAIEFAPVVQEGLRLYTMSVPGLPWVAGQPFCAYAYGGPYFGQAWFPYHTMAGGVRMFVPQPMFPMVPQQFLPAGYAAPMAAGEFYGGNYTTIMNTNIEAVGAPAGDQYISNGEWTQQQDQYYQQNPIQNPVQPRVDYDQYSQGRFSKHYQRYQGLPASKQQELGSMEYPNYRLQGSPAAGAPTQGAPQGAPAQSAPYQPQGTIGGRQVQPAPANVPQSNTGNSDYDWGGTP